MIDDELVAAHRARGLTPDRPVMRGTAQNPDVYFQGRETVNPYYPACIGIVQEEMDKFAKIAGRQYKLVDYVGAPDAERVIVVMGSGADAVQETVENLVSQGREGRRGQDPPLPPLPARRLCRGPARRRSRRSPSSTAPRSRAPSASRSTWTSAPPSAKRWPTRRSSFDGYPVIVGGRYGLGSKEFTPAMVKAVFDNLKDDRAEEPLRGRHRGRRHRAAASASTRPSRTPRRGSTQAMFYGLGSDGTVGANKNSIKIIGERDRQQRPGLLRLRLQEGRLHHHLAPPLRQEDDPRPLPGRAGRFRRLPQLLLPGEVRHARQGQGAGPPSCSAPPSTRTRSGTPCRTRCSSRSSTRSSSST